MTSWIARRSVALVTVVGALALVPAPAAPAAPPPPARSVGQAAVEALVEAVVHAEGDVAVVDDNQVTGCMGTDPEPVAYRTDRIVLRTSMGEPAAERLVQAALGATAEVTGSETIAPPYGDDGITPVVWVSFEPPPGQTVPIVALARKLRLHPVPASPDYLVSASDDPDDGPSEWWPGGPPEAITPDQLQPPRDPLFGSGIRVLAYDVGVPSRQESIWPPNLSRLTQADVEVLDAREPFGEVDLYSKGHTLPIASVIATIAPGATVEAVRTTDLSGVGTDVTAARRMATTLPQAGPGPRLIVNAFGSPACDAPFPGADMPPLGLQMVAEAVGRRDQALIVASAGNRSSPRPHYPAAFEGVVAVGALDTTADRDLNAWTSPDRSGKPADFSNFGKWVDAWAPGVGLSTTHVNGFSFEGGETIHGYALVRGTSFAAPYVAGLIAEQMASTGHSAEEAWSDIEEVGVCVAGTDDGVAVALTAMNSTAVTPPTASQTPTC